MASWNVSIESEVVISLRPVEDREEKKNILNRCRPKPGGANDSEELLNLLLTVLIEVNISIDGTILVGGEAPTLVVDLSELGLTNRQRAGLMAVFFFLADPDDPDSLTYVLVDGTIDGDIFMVPGMVGWFSLMTFDISTTIRLQIGSTAVVQDGEVAPSLDVAPFFAIPGDPDSLMLPIRAIAEAMGATIQWNAELRIAIVIHIDFNFSFSVDEPFPDDMGEPEIIEDRTFVPRRFMSRMMGVDIEYDEETGGIYITQDFGDENGDDDDQGEDNGNPAEEDDQGEDQQ
jgi:hypothetical protein